MELKQLEFFMAAYQCGSLGKAAAQLYTTQPNVSKVIHQLERELGKPLFDRTPKGLRLTAYGRHVYQYADTILKSASLLRQTEQAERQASFSLSTYRSNLLAWLLVELHQQDPELVIWHRQGTVEEITSQVSQGLSELGVLYVSQKQLKAFRHIIRHKQLEFVELARKEACIYVGPTSPYYHRDSVTLEELGQLSFVRELSDFFSMEHHFELVSLGAVSPERLRPAVYTNSEHLTTALLMNTAIADLGIDLRHGHSHQHDIKNLRIQGEEALLALGYVTERGHILSPAAQTFIEKLNTLLKP